MEFLGIPNHVLASLPLGSPPGSPRPALAPPGSLSASPLSVTAGLLVSFPCHLPPRSCRRATLLVHRPCLSPLRHPLQHNVFCRVAADVNCVKPRSSSSACLGSSKAPKALPHQAQSLRELLLTPSCWGPVTSGHSLLPLEVQLSRS